MFVLPMVCLLAARMPLVCVEPEPTHWATEKATTGVCPLLLLLLLLLPMVRWMGRNYRH